MHPTARRLRNALVLLFFAAGAVGLPAWHRWQGRHTATHSDAPRSTCAPDGADCAEAREAQRHAPRGDSTRDPDACAVCHFATVPGETVETAVTVLSPAAGRDGRACPPAPVFANDSRGLPFACGPPA